MPPTPRTTNEQRTVELMIRLYCRHKEGNMDLCPQCRELLEYATSRLARCPFQDNKPTCRLCKVHCYKPEKREQIRQMMRYAGPRMIIYHPTDAIKHMIKEMMLKIRQKRK
ncbi:nitrous oxide-stimulated promoter family protein [uncultured Prevotella sp.]|uniref:nitrous oxide-stimulated promoter family protein n=1 Tax=uncultured Prevotella sp. TaxID=159272 RepID=UPI00260E38D7|nr:nitrous oxide-stimulated promoter family protein [uncultured Prevotella sp.]